MSHNTLVELILKDAVESANGCLEYRKNLRSGYGRVKYKSKAYSAHRIILENVQKPLDTTLKALHSCDNPSCVKLEHLRWGSQKDNTADAINRGRYVKMIGSTNGRAKLTDKLVLEIKELYQSGKTQRQIGDLFGMSNQMISNIVTGKSWKHLTPEWDE
jgi:hypothetical protein